MASLIASYNYTIDIELVIGTKSYTLPANSVKTIIINYKYDKNNMPTLYLGLRLSSDMYNRMVVNADKATLSFRLFKFDTTGVSSVHKPYIEDRFTYEMSSDPNYNETFEQFVSGVSTKAGDSAESYLEGYIGLISIKCVNDNRKMFNDIIKNTDLISIIHRYTNHMNMCIEPLDNNTKIEQFIIPPITSITRLMEYLNNNYCFYKSGYRFFRDFNTTYLLSVDGNPVRDRNNKFNTVIISVRDPLDDLGKINSMELDRTNQAYIIYVNANDTSISIDRNTDKQYNSIIGVDTLGNTIEEGIAIPGSPDSTKKPILERVTNNNLEKIYNTKKTIESASIVLSVAKTEIDSTILTPNKEYQVRNYSGSREYDGRYVLSYKKEIMYQQDDSYIGSVMFGLRRVEES